MVKVRASDELPSAEGPPEPEPPVAHPHLLEALIRSSGELFAVLDTEGVIKFIDGSREIRLGSEPGFLVGSNVFDLLQHSDFERAGRLWAQRVSTKEAMPAADFWVERRDGTWLCLNLVLNNLLDDPAVRGILVTARDVTDRVNFERARVSVSAANSALVHASTEADLFDRLCRLVIDDVTYHLAWIGLADPSRFLGVRMVAFADHSAAYVEALEALAGTETYRGPIALAFETRELQVVQDVAAMPEPSAWQRLALSHGYRSVIALPLFLDEDDFGVLAIYSEWTNVFTPDAIAVLSEVSGDLSYGIKSLRNKADQSALQLRFQGSLEAAVTAIATASEMRDPYTAGHQRRVGELAPRHRHRDGRRPRADRRDPGRGDDPRRREADRARRDPQQPWSPQGSRIRADKATPSSRLRHRRRDRVSVARPRDGAPAPRAPRRLRVPQWASRREDRHRRPYHRRRGHRGGDHFPSALPSRTRARGGDQGDQRRPRQPVRP